MLLKAFTIYDKKALQYHPPFFKPADGSALRDFGDLCNDPNTTIGRHPSDYSLYCMGTYSDANGSLEPEIPLRHIADGAALVRHAPALGDLFPNSAEATVREHAARNGTGNDDHLIKGA